MLPPRLIGAALETARLLTTLELKLVLAESPAREMVMRFGPKAGQTIKVPRKKRVKFRVAKAAKDAILGAKK